MHDCKITQVIPAHIGISGLKIDKQRTEQKVPQFIQSTTIYPKQTPRLQSFLLLTIGNTSILY